MFADFYVLCFILVRVDNRQSSFKGFAFVVALVNLGDNFVGFIDMFLHPFFILMGSSELRIV